MIQRHKDIKDNSVKGTIGLKNKVTRTSKTISVWYKDSRTSKTKVLKNDYNTLPQNVKKNKFNSQNQEKGKERANDINTEYV